LPACAAHLWNPIADDTQTVRAERVLLFPCASHVGMPSTLTQRMTTEEKPWSGDSPLCNPLGKTMISTTCITHCSEAPHQHSF
jgi:hypothetical protein